MRILMTTDSVGGVWSFTNELSRGLLENGSEVALVSLWRMPTHAQRAWADGQHERWGARFRYVALDTPLEWMNDNEHAFSGAAHTLLQLADQLDADLLLSSQYCFGALQCDLPRAVVAHSDVLSWAEACRPNGLEPSIWLDIYCELVQAGLKVADAGGAPARGGRGARARGGGGPRGRAV